MYGGRGGLKSWACVQALLALGDSAGVRILCAREIQKSIRESVHQLICDTIVRMGMEDRWEIQNDRILNKYTGSKINFVGLHNNTANIKSYEGTDIVWVEEAQAVTERSWDDLCPTILRKNGAEIWLTFNPDSDLDETYVRFVTNPRDRSWVMKTSWRDADAVGWFTDAMRREKDQMKAENYKKFLHVWEGEPNSNFEDAIIQPEWVEAAKDAHLKMNWEPLGTKVSAFDPADTGDDKGLVVRHGFLVEHVSAWTNAELPESIKKAYQTSFEHRADTLVYDADGLGAAMKVNLDQNEKEYKVTAAPFKGGMSPDDPDVPYPPIDYRDGIPEKIVTNKQTFRNKRAQYYWFLADRFERTYNAVTKNQWVDPDQCISICSDKVSDDDFRQLRRELTRIARKPGANSSLITLMSKDDMRKIGIKSPGRADALMMSFPNPEAFGSTIDIPRRSEWK